jgi:hypothetical protein
MGGNGRQGAPDEVAPTQGHVPVAWVEGDVLVSKPLKPGGRVVSAVLRVGAKDVSRLSEGERRDFLERYTAVVAKWRFPYQILVWRERQNLAEFVARTRERASTWTSQGQREYAALLKQLNGWIERVIVKVNPQVPVYYIVLPCAASDLLGRSYEKALDGVNGRAQRVMHNLATLRIPCRRMRGDEITRLIAAFYHPSLPMLRLPPRERLQSLMVGEGEEGA